MTRTSPSLFDDPRAAWEPYNPSSAEPWDAARVAHLRRRAGFGATWGQITRDAAEGFEPSIRRVLDGEARTPDGREAAAFESLVETMRQSFFRRPSMERVSLLWTYRLVFSPHPLAEVMTLAWHSHYASSQDKVGSPEAMLEQNRALRLHWRARMSRLHSAMLSDTAMLAWLDGIGSTKASPNENLGREFLELFALGPGNYTEKDVRETARAFTGWRRTSYQPLKALQDGEDVDHASKTILGETGDWLQDDVVRIVLRQPAAAEHVARRLYRTFVVDAPPSRELIAPLAEAMRVDGDVDVAKGIETILRSRLFHSAECRARMVKSPAMLAVGAVRACEGFHPPVDLAALERWLGRMGQRLFHPPGVAGWPAGPSWLDDATIVARVNFAAWFTGAESGLSGGHFQDLADRHGWKTAEERRDGFSTLLLAAPLGSLAEDDAARIVRLMLSSPEGQLA
ncbi:DUF1800 domain-containing protein [Paludisphaera rhizosphaerae]|uniref:DUF1800 domain-containing protein n=1 Tax=Paludisphaera rhizosphaerae TaxID=2711216 RepID=UPI0013EBA55E|nr:DUF1800 family protein [Paludisphaera rhizosphaerae]